MLIHDVFETVIPLPNGGSICLIKMTIQKNIVNMSTTKMNKINLNPNLDGWAIVVYTIIGWKINFNRTNHDDACDQEASLNRTSFLDPFRCE